MYCVLCTVTIGQAHPERLDEGSALSCIPTPDPSYEIMIEPRHYETVEGKPAWLSNAQLEAVIFACQAHKTVLQRNDGSLMRQGFLLGK